MNQNQLDILDYLVEYAGLFDGTALEVAEKVLFDGSLDDLDSLEKEVYQKDIQQHLNPACEGPGKSGCQSGGKVEPEQVLGGYQSGEMLCLGCQELAGLREAS